MIRGSSRNPGSSHGKGESGANHLDPTILSGFLSSPSLDPSLPTFHVSERESDLPPRAVLSWHQGDYLPRSQPQARGQSEPKPVLPGMQPGPRLWEWGLPAQATESSTLGLGLERRG